ncbi:hypothetical protein BSKO_11771 [Bryopsis sp. KO-2023]|nr:hypothetical protein BSKO_11771 [Bryopsis sp. KO-2023]
MYGNGCNPLRRSTLSVAFSLLLSSAVAYEDRRGDEAGAIAGVGAFFALLAIGICLWKWISDSNCGDDDDDDRADDYVTYPGESVRSRTDVVPVNLGLVNISAERISDWRNHLAPSMLSGRYKGSRGGPQGRLNVEYDLVFDVNGSIQGTMSPRLENMKVLGWYNPKRRRFEWAEGNHQKLRDSFGTSESYVRELTRISNVFYPGRLRHAEVSMRVLEGNLGILSLTGEYTSSDGTRGDQQLVFQPAPPIAPASSDRVCVEIPPLSAQQSESMETKLSRLEPALEKEEL